MIKILTDVPANVAGFRALGEVTQDDYKDMMVPHITHLIQEADEINFLFVIDTALGNFTIGAWLQDGLLGLKHLTKWNRGAIVTDSDNAIKFTDIFSLIAPDEFKGFHKDNYTEAVDWVSEKKE
jgi:hypothetical protein